MAKKVLIVDDSEVFGRAMVSRLIANKYQASSARSATEGIKAIQSDRPDVVVIDVNMPVTDGFEMYQQMQALPELRSLPVIFVSGDYQEDVLRKARACGIKDVLPKVGGGLLDAINAATQGTAK